MAAVSFPILFLSILAENVPDISNNLWATTAMEKNARENESRCWLPLIRTELVDKIDKLKQPKLIKLIHVQLGWLLPVEILNLLTLFKWVAYHTVALKGPRGEWSIKYTHKKRKERPKLVDRKIIRL